MAQTFGAYLQRLLRSSGMPVARLVREAGISRATIYRWLAGQYQPNLYELEQVLKVLGVSVSERRRALTLIDAPRSVIRLRQESEHPSALPFMGDLLKAMRLRQALTQEEVARALGVQRSTVNRWERSEMFPTNENLHALCFLLKASTEEMTALTAGKIHLRVPPDEKPFTLEHIEEWHHHLQQDVFSGNTHLMDLNLLSLESQACTFLRHHIQAKRLMGFIYSTHARCFVIQARCREAENYAYRV